MGSTPGRHLELTEVTDGEKKATGESPNVCNKKVLQWDII